MIARLAGARWRRQHQNRRRGARSSVIRCSAPARATARSPPSVSGRSRSARREADLLHSVFASRLNSWIRKSSLRPTFDRLGQQVARGSDVAGQTVQFLAHVGAGWLAARLPAQSAPPAAAGVSRSSVCRLSNMRARAPLADRRPGRRRPGAEWRSPSTAASSIDGQPLALGLTGRHQVGQRGVEPRLHIAAARSGCFLLLVGLCLAQHAGQRQQRLGRAAACCRGCGDAAPWRFSAPAPAPPDRVPAGFGLALDGEVGGDVAALQRLARDFRASRPPALSQPFGRRKRSSRPRPLTLRSSHAQANAARWCPRLRANPVIEAIAVMARLLTAARANAKHCIYDGASAPCKCG